MNRSQLSSQIEVLCKVYIFLAAHDKFFTQKQKKNTWQCTLSIYKQM